jgi:hypothetical protein
MSDFPHKNRKQPFPPFSFIHSFIHSFFAIKPNRMIGGLLDSNPMMMAYKFEAFSLFQPKPPITSPSSIRTKVRKRNESSFQSEFAPGPHDVICQRGKDCNEHGKSFFAIHTLFLCVRSFDSIVAHSNGFPLPLLINISW